MRYVVFISVLWIEKGCILTNICTQLYLGMKNLSKGHLVQDSRLKYYKSTNSTNSKMIRTSNDNY